MNRNKNNTNNNNNNNNKQLNHRSLELIIDCLQL